MVSPYAQAKLYALNLADRLIRVELMEFFTNVHRQFYQGIDVKFMEYFLSIAEREGEFVVHHSKLVEYGVMTSSESSKVREKLSSLGLEEGHDFTLADVRERGKSGSQTHRHYHLTPEAFKMCLMRAQRRADQPIDPVTYVKYYLLLEKIFGLYREYQAAYQGKIIAMKDDKIDKLISEVAEQSSVIQRLESMAITQNDKMDKLMDYAEDIKSRLDSLFDFTSAFAKSTLSTWIGSLVFKSQLDQLIRDKDLNYALKHLKILYTVAFYRVIDGQQSDFAIYFCCTNFADVNKRIRDLHSRHEDMVMLKPEAICLMSQEINCERSSIEHLVLDPLFTFNTRRKSYQTTLQTDNVQEIEQTYDSIVKKTRAENFQGYQMRRDEVIAGNNEVNESVLREMVRADASFFESSLPRCQEYLDYYTTRDTEGYKPVHAVSRKTMMRQDLNERMTDTMYTLHKLHSLLGDDGGVKEIQKMIREGVMTQRDLKSLVKLSKAAAEAENMKLSEEEKAHVAEVEALPDA